MKPVSLICSRAIALLLLLAPTIASAALKLPAVFSDHMVIQSGQPTPIWGQADPGDTIKVTFLDPQGAEKSTTSATADDKGAWRAELPTLPSNQPGRLLIEGAKSGQHEIADILTGEVWLASGQSNMAYRVGNTSAAPVTPKTLDEAKAQAEAARGAIRYFVTTRVSIDTPQTDVQGKWVVAGPDNVGFCSAVAWYFGVRLHDQLQAPIGLLISAVGGTPAQAWTPAAALDATPVAAAIRKRDEEAIATNTNPKPGDKLDPAYLTRLSSRLYNGMIAGLGDYGIKGIIWYQADGNLKFPLEYGDLIQALIKSWRQQWHAELPFYYVEMNERNAPQTEPADNGGMPFLREQQAAALQLPRTGVAAAHDSGRVENPTNNAHYPVKKTTGDRFANLALTEVYSQSLGEVQSPAFASYTVEGDKIRLKFTHAEGLKAIGDGTVKGFVIKGTGDWQWAEAKLEGNEVIVWNPATPKPTEVRYAWATHPIISLENAAALPLRPFRATIKENAQP